MQQIIGINLANMSQEELLSLSDQIFEEINKRNNRGLEYGQKVLINGKYAAHPDFQWGNYERYVGSIAYIRDPEVVDEGENGFPFVTVKKTPKYYARSFDVHPDDIVVLGYVELDEYQPRPKK
ncbi:hypothetical protein QTG56_25440 (plasmid) [Rossellomorea sp. AcN35-11]|nr:hypothetical protein [Rossellomorea aquimaris]WJV31960.1 hypothetical protein QTG56_25440 [Rossellomorea sp. AcN35-11]